MKTFECQMCGECCYGEGGIAVDKEERKRIARFLQISVTSLEHRYCEERHGRLYITTGKDNFCIFFKHGKGCTIHAVKPETCARWPYFAAIVRDEENWELAKDACPGINRETSFRDFVREARKARSPCKSCLI